MKKILQVFSLLFCICNYSQIITIPDANFKARLLAANETTVTIAAVGTLPNNLVNIRIDANENGEIEQSEVQNITYLNVSASNISDLTGIEYFINLKYIFCNQNNLTTVNNLNGLVHLERLFCDQNQLTNLNLTTFSNLKILTCTNNAITTLNVTNNTVLERLACANTLVSTLDFSYNPQFIDLSCKNNPNLTSIKIRNGAQQVFASGMIYPNDCWSNCPNLSYICADANEIAPLQTYLSNCGVSTSGITIDSACALGVDEFDFASVQVYPNPSDGKFTILFDATVENATIEVYTLLGQKIFYEKFDTTNEKLVNIAGLANGTYLLKIDVNGQTFNKRIIIK